MVCGVFKNVPRRKLTGGLTVGLKASNLQVFTGMSIVPGPIV
jgi:hypothetical protein